jgi:tetratricopeptide (TPR) repeat protein
MPRLDWRPLGSAQVRRELFDKAIGALQARRARRPGDTETTLRLAEVFLMAGEGARAIPLYQEAVQQRPREVFPIESLAVAYYDQYQYEPAIAAMQAAIRLAREVGTPPLVMALEQRLRGFETERDAERAANAG